MLLKASTNFRNKREIIALSMCVQFLSVEHSCFLTPKINTDKKLESLVFTIEQGDQVISLEKINGGILRGPFLVMHTAP